jgi:hypothetical protein
LKKKLISNYEESNNNKLIKSLKRINTFKKMVFQKELEVAFENEQTSFSFLIEEGMYSAACNNSDIKLPFSLSKNFFQIFFNSFSSKENIKDLKYKMGENEKSLTLMFPWKEDVFVEIQLERVAKTIYNSDYVMINTDEKICDKLVTIEDVEEDVEKDVDVEVEEHVEDKKHVEEDVEEDVEKDVEDKKHVEEDVEEDVKEDVDVEVEIEEDVEEDVKEDVDVEVEIEEDVEDKKHVEDKKYVEKEEEIKCLLKKTYNKALNELFLKCCQDGKLEYVKYLFENEPGLLDENQIDLEFRDSKHDSTNLCWAACNGHLKVVEYLVEQKADINGRGNQKCTPIMLASMHGRLEVVKYLLEKGANVHFKSDRRMNALDYAYEDKKYEILACLAPFYCKK